MQNDSARTSSAPGPNPAWNQQLTLNLSSGNNANLSSETLDTIKDHLHIHLFDEVSVDLLEDPSERSHHIHRRLEQKWLGSLSVPFSSLYRNTRVEGTFRLHSPAVLLGYERTGHLGGVLAAAGGDEGDPRQHSRQDATYVNLYLTVEPPLSVPDPPAERLECAEEGEAVVRLCERWSKDMANKFPDRKVIFLGKCPIALKFPISIYPYEGPSSDS